MKVKSNLSIGDKLKCSNGHTYTLIEGDGFYTFSIIDEFGEEVNKGHDYYIEDCISSCNEDYCPLCVGEDNNGYLKYTDILEVIKCNTKH